MANIALSYLALLLVLSTHVRNIAQSAPDAYGYQFQWGAWKEARGRSYSSVEEEKERYSVWLDNMRYIEQHNREADKHGFSLKMNSFGDTVSCSHMHACSEDGKIRIYIPTKCG